VEVNLLVKDVRAASKQKLIFGGLEGTPWYKLAAVQYADASRLNRREGYSTGGLLTALAAILPTRRRGSIGHCGMEVFQTTLQSSRE
jgi:hypothetical protein